MEKQLQDLQAQLIHLTRHFLLEQGGERAANAVTLQVSLERQLGIDSLGKVELFRRIEREMGVTLSDKVMAEADTLQYIAEMLISSNVATFSFKKNVIPLSPHVPVDVNISQVTTLQEVLIAYARFYPERTHLYLQDEEGEETPLTYGELLEKAYRIGNGLIHYGIQPNDTVSIMLPTGFDFFQCFFGILFAGAIPVPIYPPFRKDRLEEYVLRETKILNNAEVRALITFKEAELLSRLLKSDVRSLARLITPDKLSAFPATPPNLPYESQDTALLQYTSGSTGDPKGILLTHQNILANLRATGEAIQIKPTESVVSWLPLYHDMGLFSWINSLYFGVPITVLSPISFLNRPEKWLWAIHYHQATMTAAPNFAYELCVKKIEDDAIQGLNLSSLRLACNGAEYVNPKTLERFYRRFKSYGLKKTALFPVYGLAENTVALATPELNREVRIDTIAKLPFESEMKALPANPYETFLEFVSEGKPIPHHAIRIVDDNNEILPERHVGKIQFQGPSAMRGYFRNEDATRQIYHAGWWDTGDLGYIAEGDLFLTGRKKDVIIKAGRNLYPEIIEEIVGDIEGIRKGCVIAFGVSDGEIGTEKIIIVAESKVKVHQDKLISLITKQVDIGIGIPPDQIIILPPNKIPKTSSGKLQRAACKKAYLNDELPITGATTHWQIIKLLLSATKKSFRRFFKNIFRGVYTLYFLMILILITLPVWMLILMMPSQVGGRLIKKWARVLLFCMFCPVKVKQHQNFAAIPLIFTANHASYMDSVVLVAILPENTLFIGKKELLKVPVIGSTMRKLKYLTVDRMDFSKNIHDTKNIKQQLERGHSILIFPEGTFTYASGVRPFKTGAFQLAVDAQVSICPVAIKNTRKLLREGSYLLTPTRIHIYMGEAIKPHGNNWQEVLRLRQTVRKVISKHAGEAMMDLMV